MEPLLLDGVPEALWRAFQAGPRGALAQASSVVLGCWQRARELGAPPDGGGDEGRIERGVALSERVERSEPLLVDGGHLLRDAAAAAAERDFVLLVADREGVLVHTAGGGGFAEEARRVRLIDGAHWSELARGTNAIGTALHERRPAVVRGSAHYGQRFHGLVCTAAPVFDADGEVVAVLDATSATERAHAEVSMLVRATALALGEVLRLRALASLGASALRALGRTLERAPWPAVLFEAPGRVGRLNAAARERLGLSQGQSVREALGMRWEELTREALRGQGAVVARAQRAWTLRAEPLLGSDGAVLAVLAHFDPAPTSGASPRGERPALEAPAKDTFGALYAEDPALLATLARARRFARSRVPVVLLGETGSGKELLAQAVHAASDRAQGPFVAVNCGAIAPSLLEAELFGAAPHAYTGADPRGRSGFFEAANGGTLFLDEVAEMPTAMQAALLRALESGEVRRVGETRARRVDVRIVCATCRDLFALVAEGRFRSDLFYRLKGVSLTLPPLRERADVAGLARHLLARLEPGATLAEDAAAALRAHPWPGNVRELRSALEVALALAQDGVVRAEDLPLEQDARKAEEAPAEGGVLAALEGHALERVLREVAGNVSAAAKRLGVARSTLYRMMRRHKLD